MRLVCPECGAHGSLSQFASDAHARAVAATLADLPPALATSLLAYIGLFRPAKRALAWPRARRLIDELAELMRSPAIARHGRDYPVTPAMWQAALTQMIDQRERLTLPLKTHGYLLEILAGLADKADGAAEDRREADLRAGLRRGQNAPERASRAARIKQWIASETAARKRLGLPALTDDEIPKLLEQEGLQ